MRLNSRNIKTLWELVGTNYTPIWKNVHLLIYTSVNNRVWNWSEKHLKVRVADSLDNICYSNIPDFIKNGYYREEG